MGRILVLGLNSFLFWWNFGFWPKFGVGKIIDWDRILVFGEISLFAEFRRPAEFFLFSAVSFLVTVLGRTYVSTVNLSNPCFITAIRVWVRWITVIGIMDS